MLKQEKGTVVTDELAIPLLDTLLFKAYRTTDMKEKTISLASLRHCTGKTYEYFATSLCAIFDYSNNLAGFKWVVGQPEVNLFIIDGFEQKNLDNAEDREQISNVIKLALKSRKEVKSIKWMFGLKTLEVEFVA